MRIEITHDVDKYRALFEKALEDSDVVDDSGIRLQWKQERKCHIENILFFLKLPIQGQVFLESEEMHYLLPLTQESEVAHVRVIHPVPPRSEWPSL